MDSISFSLKKICDAVNEQLIRMRGNEFKSNHMVIKDRLGKEYLVSEINLENCIRDEHIIFCSYLPNEKIPENAIDTFGVAIPISLYAGIELFSSLPKSLAKTYNNKGTKVGFETVP